MLSYCQCESKEDGTENGGPHLRCAVRSLQSYDTLSRLFGTRIVICGYVQAQPQRYLQILLRLIYNISAGEGNVSAPLQKELEQKLFCFSSVTKKQPLGLSGSFRKQAKTSFPTLKCYCTLGWLFLQFQLLKSSTIR